MPPFSVVPCSSREIQIDNWGTSSPRCPPRDIRDPGASRTVNDGIDQTESLIRLGFVVSARGTVSTFRTGA